MHNPPAERPMSSSLLFRAARRHTVKRQALIFDVDGALAETERDAHRLAFNRAFAQFGPDWEWSVVTCGKLPFTITRHGDKHGPIESLRRPQPQ